MRIISDDFFEAVIEKFSLYLKELLPENFLFQGCSINDHRYTRPRYLITFKNDSTKQVENVFNDFIPQRIECSEK